MLYAQLELRRNIQKTAATEDDDGEAVIYVEGEEEISSDEAVTEEGRLAINRDSRPDKSNKRKPAGLQHIEENESSEDDEMPTTVNGIDHVEESDDESEDSEVMYDEEAEETENDTGDDLSEPDSDAELDDGEESEESEEDVRPTKRSMAAHSGLSRR